MAENPAGIILSVVSIGFGAVVMASGWSLIPMRWLGGTCAAVGIAGLARIAGIV